MCCTVVGYRIALHVGVLSLSRLLPCPFCLVAHMFALRCIAWFLCFALWFDCRPVRFALSLAWLRCFAFSCICAAGMRSFDGLSVEHCGLQGYVASHCVVLAHVSPIRLTVCLFFVVACLVVSCGFSLISCWQLSLVCWRVCFASWLSWWHCVALCRSWYWGSLGCAVWRSSAWHCVSLGLLSFVRWVACLFCIVACFDGWPVRCALLLA